MSGVLDDVTSRKTEGKCGSTRREVKGYYAGKASIGNNKLRRPNEPRYRLYFDDVLRNSIQLIDTVNATCTS